MSDEDECRTVIRGPWSDPVTMSETEFLEWLQDHLVGRLRSPRVITLHLDVYLPV